MSSYHGGFGEDGVVGTSELTPFSDFTNINSLLYFHEFVYQFSDLLSKVFGELPPWAFYESIRGNNKPKPFDESGADWKKRKRSNPNAATEAAFKHFNQSNDKKNKIVQYGLLTDTSLKIENKLSNKRALKRELLTERAFEKKVKKGKLKRQYNQYKRYKEKKANKKAATVGGMVDTSSSEEDENIDSSQEEFFDELKEIDDSIVAAKARYNYIEGQINKMQFSTKRTMNLRTSRKNNL